MATIYSSYPPVSVAFPSGSATAANQVLQITQETNINTNLGLISAQLPATLGQKAMAASMAVVLSSDQSAIPVTLSSTTITGTVAVTQSGTWNLNNISGTISLPTGAATEATLASLDAAIPDGLTVTSNRLLVDGSGVTQPVSGTFWQATQPISAASLPLPTGAATETTLASVDGKLPLTLGQKAMTASLAVALASDQSAIPVTLSSTTISGTVAATQSGTWNITNVSGTVSLPTGASTETTLSGMSAKLPAALGQTTMANSMSVTIASNQSTIPVSSGGVAAVTKSRLDYTSTSVTTAAYVQLVASTGSTINSIEIFDSSGQTLVLATGAAASEVDQIYIFPGGNGRVPLTIASGTRISIKAVSATASVGENTINYYA